MDLFAFPFAGGGENCYKEFEPHIEHMQLKTQSLPGRGKLFGKPCITDVESMVDFQLQQIKDSLHRPYAFFGHSMGAFIAYMLARKISLLSKLNPNILTPKFLVLSGRRGPSVAETEIKHLMQQQQFRDMLKELGGIPEMVWQDEDIMDLFEPVIRADFQLLETYQYVKKEPIDIPLHLFLGRDDNVSEADAREWQHETSHNLTIDYFAGGHFFFSEAREQVGECLTELFIRYHSPAMSD